MALFFFPADYHTLLRLCKAQTCLRKLKLKPINLYEFHITFNMFSYLDFMRSGCSISASGRSRAAIKSRTKIENIYEFWELLQFSPFMTFGVPTRWTFFLLSAKYSSLQVCFFSRYLHGETLTYLLLCVAEEWNDYLVWLDLSFWGEGHTSPESWLTHNICPNLI